MGWRVDDVPWWGKPVFWAYGYGVGWAVCLLVTVLRGLCRVEFRGIDSLPPDTGYIFALWHRHNMPMFVSFLLRRHRHVCLNHPAWFMKPVHVVLRYQGVRRIILGSTGTGGRAAADEVVQALRGGYSTFINPDGPAGPVGRLKKGALHMAAQSGVPIVPVIFELSRSWSFRGTWDRKTLPLPFSRVLVRLGRPMHVSPSDLDASADELTVALGPAR